MSKNQFEILTQVIADRYSCRNYSSMPVSRQEIDQVLEMARLAPSACNRQPWVFVVVDTPELREAVVASYDRPWVRTAPAFIVACGNHDEAWHRAADQKDHTDVDVSIAVEHICLAASAIGLGTCWVCNFDVALLRQALNIPANLEPIAIIPIGYPEVVDVAPEKKRKSLDDITVWGKF